MTALSNTSLMLDTNVEARLQKLAATKRRPADRLMCEAIEQYVAREEGREQLRQDVLAAWEEYQATGQHVTAEEADAWLARLEAGEDADPPTPHK